jgi:3-oxoacyl-[acyl-carrier protein] reductase
MALEFGARGYRVAVHYARSETAAQEVAQIVRDRGGEASVFGADVSQPDACQKLIGAVIESFGALDVLVNNAGITKDTLALRMKTPDWQSVLDIDLSSAFYLSKTALRGMLRREFGRIINISSVVGLMGNAGQANYAAAKAGLIGLTKALAREYAGKGVTVNAVAPGFVESDLTTGLPEDVKAAYLAQIPMGRFGDASEIAKVVAFLASEDASYLTGQTLIVDGGLLMP